MRNGFSCCDVDQRREEILGRGNDANAASRRGWDGMQLHVMKLQVTWILGLLAKALLLFYYGFLDIGRDRVIQRMKIVRMSVTMLVTFITAGTLFSAMLNCFPDDSQLDAELAKMSRLPALREDEQSVYSADTSKFGGAKV